MCTTENKQKQCDRKEWTAGHVAGGGVRNEGMNFCVNMVECTVGMGVSMLPLYEGRVPCSTEIKKKEACTMTFWEHLGLMF